MAKRKPPLTETDLRAMRRVAERGPARADVSVVAEHHRLLRDHCLRLLDEIERLRTQHAVEQQLHLFR
jgi:hypothetical protein